MRCLKTWLLSWHQLMIEVTCITRTMHFYIITEFSATHIIYVHQLTHISTSFFNFSVKLFLHIQILIQSYSWSTANRRICMVDANGSERLQLTAVLLRTLAEAVFFHAFQISSSTLEWGKLQLRFGICIHPWSVCLHWYCLFCILR